MNREEAIAYMEQGCKMTHYLFDPHEWVTYKDGRVLHENGATLDKFTFWQDRGPDVWQGDWDFWEPPSPEPLKGSTEEPLTDNEEELEIARLCSAFFGTLAQAQKPLDPRIAKVVEEHFWEYCGSASPLEPLHETTDEEIHDEARKIADAYKGETGDNMTIASAYSAGAKWMRSRLLPSNPEIPSNEWIPVSERLPECAGGDFIVCAYGEVGQSYYNKPHGFFLKGVTHWCALPLPPTTKD